MAEIVWTDESKFWLKEIYEYICLENRDAAWKTITGIKDKTEILIENSNIGYTQEKLGIPKNVRFILYGHYRIAYRVHSDQIQILGVFHGKLDIKRHLKST